MASHCMWGSRLAVPLGLVEGATVDHVRTLVDEVHRRIDVEFPPDEYFLNVLGTGRLADRLPKPLSHLGGRQGRVLILGSYKIRQPHFDALQDIQRSDGNEFIKALAKMTRPLGQQAVRDCVDALVPEVRGGAWYWRGGTTNRYEALMQEHRAWEHLGAAPRDLSHYLRDALRSLATLEQKHGGADPAKWRWGEGESCADVFAADEAKREHENLSTRVAAFRQLCDNPPRDGNAARDRSRSPVR